MLSKKSINLPNSSSAISQVELVITGRVQGVTFRYFVNRWATKLGIAGYVANQSDGSVYVLAQGTTQQLEQLIQKCYAGPEHAQVTIIISKFTPLADRYSTFTIKH